MAGRRRIEENLRMGIIWLYYDVPVAGHEER